MILNLLVIIDVIPKSRTCKKRSNKNIALVPNKKHQQYHAIFSNFTPMEIINELVENYWNGDWRYVEEALTWREYTKGD